MCIELNKQLSIDEIKNCENQILNTFADFCNENNLKYYLAYGTLLGAIRHKGFIPWDDDIDVEMPRSDYNKLIEILAKKNNFISENIELKTPFCKGYQYPFSKVIDNTTYVQEVTMKKKYKTSIWIDIFPLDKLPDSKKQAERFISKIQKMNKYYFYTIERKYSGNDLLGKIKFNTIRAILTPIYSIINQKERINRFAQKYEDNETKFCSGLIGNNLINERIMEMNDFSQTSVIFEGKSYTTFKNYDKILRNFYGDYMQFPPEEERVLAHSLTAYKK